MGLTPVQAHRQIAQLMKYCGPIPYVNKIALSVSCDLCRLGEHIQTHTFPNASHLGILRDDRAVPFIVGIITKPTSWRCRLWQRLRNWSLFY